MNANIWDKNRIYDVVILGSGMGGSALAYGLQESGLSVLVVERGDFIPQEKQNWDIDEIVTGRRYAANEVWIDKEGQPFTPRIYYNVGGNTKFYGGSAFRLREKDFDTWPISYFDLSPWYDQAEKVLRVRGLAGDDPTEPPREPYPYPPTHHEPVIEDLSCKITAQGLHPFHLPIAVDQGLGGRCKKGSPCDGFPCMVRAKGDAENSFLRPLLLRSNSNVTLLRNAFVEKLVVSPNSASIDHAVILLGNEQHRVLGKKFVVAAGAVNSAALLLRSANNRFPQGIANSSGIVGRNYMAHLNTVLIAFSPFKKNPTVFQKTLAVNDYYLRGWGNIQLRGKIHPPMLQNRSRGLLKVGAGFIAPRSIDLWLMTEDYPDPDNRVTLGPDNSIHLSVVQKNTEAHKNLVRASRNMMQRAGYPFVFVDPRGVSAVQHQCGTIRFGTDSKTAPLDPYCRSYDHPNLFVVDASFFPTSGAVNPALTIAAQALRVANHMGN